MKNEFNKNSQRKKNGGDTYRSHSETQSTKGEDNFVSDMPSCADNPADAFNKKIEELEKEIENEIKEPITKAFLDELREVNKGDNFMLKNGININTRLIAKSVKLSAFKEAQEMFLKMIDSLKFKGRFKGIDEETDRAYRKGTNDVLEELKKQVEGK